MLGYKVGSDVLTRVLLGYQEFPGMSDRRFNEDEIAAKLGVILVRDTKIEDTMKQEN